MWCMTTIEEQKHDTAAADEIEAAAEKIFEAALGALSVQAIFLGDRLGWYRALAEADSLTPIELAAASNTDARYAREWLEQQTVAGYVIVDDPTLGPDVRRYRLPAPLAEVLANPESLTYMAPFPRLVASLGKSIDHTLEAFRTGGGVGWHVHGADAREAQAAANRPMFLKVLGQEYLSAIPAVDKALRNGGRVADIGCGLGWSSIGVALAYPEAIVDGYDVDAPSVEAARRNAAEAGVADRVSFAVVDASEAGTKGVFDLVMALECVHDMADPVSVLASMGDMVKSDGTVIVMDERVGETFTGAPDPVEQLMYGFSVSCCLADGRNHVTSEATGTVMRPSTLDGYARRAGFARSDILDLENDFFRFYELIQTDD